VSRVHDALRRAEFAGALSPPQAHFPAQPPSSPVAAAQVPPPGAPVAAAVLPEEQDFLGPDFLGKIQDVSYHRSSDFLLVDPAHPHEAPMEEFRTLRTRLNHLKTLQPLYSVVVTSPSPAEGKSLSSANLALAQSILEGNNTLLADFDFRRPIIHSYFGLDRAPGITDYLLGKAPLEKAMRRISGTSLYIMPAGEAVLNPLELLNLKEVKVLLDRLPTWFNWIILDSPPLLFSADANLLSTLCHGTLLVVRIGHTTVDSVARAMQSLCNNNVLGVVVNAARRGELYSKYTYYHSYSYAATEEQPHNGASAPPESSA
jgi:protein-tyrosine kinase